MTIIFLCDIVYMFLKNYNERQVTVLVVNKRGKFVAEKFSLMNYSEFTF